MTRLLPRFCLIAALCTTFATRLFGEENEQPRKSNTAPVELSPGVFQLGAIRIEKATNSVTFPAIVNLGKESSSDLLEYLMVTPEGSTHESLLVCEVPPRDIHLAMVLLGAKGMTRTGTSAPAGRIDADFLAQAPKLSGEKVHLIATYKRPDGTEAAVPVEEWILNAKTKKPATKGPWIYNGSYFLENKFMAQSQGVHGAMVSFPAALINNGRRGWDDQEAWLVNTATAPAAKTPITLTIRLEPGSTLTQEGQK
jgi:hypothetical protein